ncbi:uncharacterized protein [Littorina saxatilis]|uniref:uncharacterized protein isoform X2 n=1 Tax=Littorina saxatilis TaxID=31220 RepID=UPI0038B4D3C1
MWCLILLAFALRVRAEVFNIAECNRDGKFYIWKHKQPSLTCTGMKETQNIYWSLSGEKEITIGKCPKCNSTCPSCKDFDTALYNISRPDNESITLQFLVTSQIIAGSTIKCSRRNNQTNTTCLLLFSEPVSSTAWLLEAVAAGASGFLLILAVVIAIAVVLRRRKSHEEAGNKTEDTDRGDDDVAEERISAIYHEVDDTAAAENNDPNGHTSAGHASGPQASGTAVRLGNIYARVNTAEKNGYRGCPSELKNTSCTTEDMSEMTVTTESDDEYRCLQFTRPCQVDTDSTYSHLTPL